MKKKYNQPTKAQMRYIKVLCDKIPVKELFKDNKDIIKIYKKTETREDAIQLINFLIKYKDSYPIYNVFDIKIQKFLIKLIENDEPNLYYSMVSFIEKNCDLDVKKGLLQYLKQYMPIRPYLSKNKTKIKTVYEIAYEKVHSPEDFEKRLQELSIVVDTVNTSDDLDIINDDGNIVENDIPKDLEAKEE